MRWTPIVLMLLMAGAARAEDERPNIVFLFSDDHACQAIGAYGSRINETPQIDRLAREGAVFAQSFCTNSICGPSRATVLTGCFSHVNGFYANTGGRVFDGTQPTLPKLLQKAGYQTALVGKWHLGAAARASPALRGRKDPRARDPVRRVDRALGDAPEERHVHRRAPDLRLRPEGAGPDSVRDRVRDAAAKPRAAAHDAVAACRVAGGLWTGERGVPSGAAQGRGSRALEVPALRQGLPPMRRGRR